MMSRAPSNFRESDLKRALRAIEGAGQESDFVKLKGDCVEIKLKNGRIIAVNGTDADTTNPWDEVDLK
jgi:hypothetical protein